jgi:cytochrome c-type biogenesis protein CcmH
VSPVRQSWLRVWLPSGARSGACFAGRAGVAFLALVLMALALVDPAAAQTAALSPDSGLTVEQEARAKALEGKLIAPCCWVQPVAVHDSDASTQIKEQIRIMIAQGKGDQEILDGFVQQYGQRILASPPARGFNLAAYLLPLAAVLAAGVLLVVALRRWRRPAVAGPMVQSPGSSEPEDGALRKQVDEELDSFDA